MANHIMNRKRGQVPFPSDRDGVNANAPIGKRRKKAMAARRATNTGPLSLEELHPYDIEDLGDIYDTENIGDR